VPGFLVSADIYFSRLPTAGSTPLEIGVYRVIGGVPTAQLLAMETLPSTAVVVAGNPPVATHVDFSAPASFDAGEQFALAVHLQGTSGAPGLHAGLWDGSADNLYSGGQLFHSHNAVSWQPSGSGFDLYFRTFVLVPEPSVEFILLPMVLHLCRRARGLG
jgi:hypothetical protein